MTELLGWTTCAVNLRPNEKERFYDFCKQKGMKPQTIMRDFVLSLINKHDLSVDGSD